MRIVIQKLIRNYKLPTPDLITRSLGKELYNRVEKKLSHIHEGELVIIDFSNYKVLDPSFIDEFIIRLLEKARNATPFFYIKLVGLSETAIHNISHVIKLYKQAKNKRYAIATDNLVSTHKIIGELNDIETDIIHYLSVNQKATVTEISSFLEKDVEETRNILENMHTLGIIRKHNNSTDNLFCTI